MEYVTKLPLADVCKLLAKGRISSVELTKKYLENIESNKDLNAFITVLADEALEMAERIDALRSKGECLPYLAGVPFAVKDNICVSGTRTTCGSKMLSDFVSPYTATAVQRLINDGAVLLGKTNMDEFGMGSHSDTSFFGAVKNPLDKKRSIGGSSGGSAAAVAANCAAFALGSDTGGSVRLPAAFCGAVGMKPTYGAVSRYGLVAFASSLDQIGAISSDVRGNAAVMQRICGRDAMDTTSTDFSFELTHENTEFKGLRVGIVLTDQTTESIYQAVSLAADILRRRGAVVKSTDFPDTDKLVAAYYIISACEASSNLARYDGVRYGYRGEGEDIERLFVTSRSEAFGNEVKRRIMLGTFCLSQEMGEEYYKNATVARAEICQRIESIFENFDVILCPTAKGCAPYLSDISNVPLDTYKDDAFTVAANLAGIPALCVPVRDKEQKMPLSVQLMGRKFSEALLYCVGTVIESEAHI